MAASGRVAPQLGQGRYPGLGAAGCTGISWVVAAEAAEGRSGAALRLRLAVDAGRSCCTSCSTSLWQGWCAAKQACRIPEQGCWMKRCRPGRGVVCADEYKGLQWICGAAYKRTH